MKVFFDIGTNRFQGYSSLSSEWGVTDDWHKVFIEPNPDFVEDEELMKQLGSIKNAKFIPSALCCDCPQTKTMMTIENGMNMDQGANIFREDWIEEGRKSVEVSVVRFDDICIPYLEGEWHMKFDCENCEWSCLLHILSKYHKNIKNLAVEYHYPIPERFHPNIDQQIKDMANEHNINIRGWH